MKKLLLFLVLGLILLVGCEQANNSQLPNPASLYCEEQGGNLEIRTSEDGSQSGYCIFENSECEEWAFYKGECQK